MVNQIREDIKDLKKDSTTNSFEFTLWSNVDCEDAHNFTYYFPSCNPGKLGEKDMKITLMNLMKSNKKKLLKGGTESDWAIMTC